MVSLAFSLCETYFIPLDTFTHGRDIVSIQGEIGRMEYLIFVTALYRCAGV